MRDTSLTRRGVTRPCPFHRPPHVGNVPSVIGVYRVTCVPLRKVYIGASSDTCRRFIQHQDHLARGVHSNRGLQAAYDEYGPRGFQFEVLEVLPGRYDEVQLTLCEQRWLDLHPRKFNVRPAGSDWYLKHTEAGRAAVQAAGGTLQHGRFKKPLGRKGW